MKANRLLRAIGEIEDQYIAEGAPREKPAAPPASAGRALRPVRFAALAACAALVVAAALLFGRDGGVAPPPGDDVPPVLQTEPAAQTPDDNDKPAPLTLNRADAQTGADIHIPGHFWHGLTNAQREAVFPGVALPLSATAHYSGDGSVHHVAAHERAQAGSEEAAMFMDSYTRTEITIAPGEVIGCVIYEYDAQVSYVDGVAVTAGVFYGTENDGVALYIADFKLDGIAYSVQLHDSDTGGSGQTRLTEIVNALVRGGGADLSVLDDPVIPELRDEQLTLEDARLDADFGAYLPGSVPAGFAFESAHRFINQTTDALYVHWYAGYDGISWTVRQPEDNDLERIVGVGEREKYDMSLYSIPFADSVPEELWEVVDCPVFRAEELTLDLIRARAYRVRDSGDSGGPRMRFAVLYGDAVAEISTKGVSPEELWEMLRAL